MLTTTTATASATFISTIYLPASNTKIHEKNLNNCIMHCFVVVIIVVVVVITIGVNRDRLSLE